MARGTRLELVGALVGEYARVPTINDHTHVIAEPDRLRRDLDALAYLAHPYVASDLLASGMTAADLRFATGSEGDLAPPDDRPPPGPLDARWARVAPFWARIRHGGFARCLLEGWDATFGIPDLDASTVGELSARIRAARVPGHYRQVLHDEANIKVSLVQMTGTYGEDIAEVDRTLFLPVPRLNRFTMVRRRADLEALESELAIPLRTLDALDDAMAGCAVRWKAAGAPAIKLSQSYHRAMDFDMPDHTGATRALRTVWDGGYPGLDSAPGRVLEDWLVDAAVRAATAARLPVEFHVGPRAGIYGTLEGTFLAPMAPFLRRHRDALFDISHAGFPALREAAVLAKTFANVYLNLSWLHIYSPQACIDALQEWVQMVPVNKVLGFGDDLYWVDTIHGHLRIARRNVAFAMAGLVEDGVIRERDAVEIGRALFHDNPAAFYGIR